MIISNTILLGNICILKRVFAGFKRIMKKRRPSQGANDIHYKKKILFLVIAAAAIEIGFSRMIRTVKLLALASGHNNVLDIVQFAMQIELKTFFFKNLI